MCGISTNFTCVEYPCMLYAWHTRRVYSTLWGTWSMQTCVMAPHKNTHVKVKLQMSGTVNKLLGLHNNCYNHFTHHKNWEHHWNQAAEVVFQKKLHKRKSILFGHHFLCMLSKRSQSVVLLHPIDFTIYHPSISYLRVQKYTTEVTLSIHNLSVIIREQCIPCVAWAQHVSYLLKIPTAWRVTHIFCKFGRELYHTASYLFL